MSHAKPIDRRRELLGFTPFIPAYISQGRHPRLRHIDIADCFGRNSRCV
jgi:hypothetical protein